MSELLNKNKKRNQLIMKPSDKFGKQAGSFFGQLFLFATTSISALAIIFMFIFIIKESLPFFDKIGNVVEFFTSADWTPSKAQDPSFGALAIIYGTLMVTFGACLIAVPIGITVAICLSDIVSHKLRKSFKPIMELLAAIPSVAYGFFALVLLAPLLQDYGGAGLSITLAIIGIPAVIIISLASSELLSQYFFTNASEKLSKKIFWILILIGFSVLTFLCVKLFNTTITSGTNALNVSLILGIMALPTIVSISEDALSSVGRDMREGSLSLGATRFETIFKVIVPCAKSGIIVAVILGFMRVIGETMVVWMASGNAIKIPEPFYNFFEPVRTMTATIAGEMGEADQSTGSLRYHVLFAMSLCLLVSSVLMNAVSQMISHSSKFKKA